VLDRTGSVAKVEREYMSFEAWIDDSRDGAAFLGVCRGDVAAPD
jgi:hypothetical protein